MWDPEEMGAIAAIGLSSKFHLDSFLILLLWDLEMGATMEERWSYRDLYFWGPDFREGIMMGIP